MGGQHLLVCSIGNPAPYTNTLHSAGHMVLSAIAKILFYKFEKARGGGNLVSVGKDFTLWQSGAYMNISGKSIEKALKFYSGRRLIVLHDEMELPLGRIKVTSGQASPKGHKGLKSIMTREYTRIGIGIDRPNSREPDLVAAYVLRKVKEHERVKIEACAIPILEELRKMS